jgi:hypothetical protein
VAGEEQLDGVIRSSFQERDSNHGR